MLGKNNFFLALIVVVAVLSACDGRYLKHKKHQKHHERGSKKTFVRYVQVGPGWRKQMQVQAQTRCCASAQPGFTPEDPYACCQSASPPPCCQQSAQFQPQMPLMQPPQSYMQPQGFMPSSGCCSQSGAPMMAGQSPYSCCQSASPPPCCHQGAQFQPQVPPPQLFMQSPGLMPSPGCCSQSVASMMPGQSPYSCCQSSSPPPCCNQAMAAPQPPQMPVASSGCCSSSPPPLDSNGIYLGLVHPDQHCCRAPNPPPCCFGLHLKPGESKNISMKGGGKNYVLSVHLSNGTKDNTTTKPCKVPTCAPPTSVPTSAATSAPTNGPTSAGSPGPSKPSTLAPTSGANGSTTAVPSPGGSGGGNECQKKALAEHNAKRQIHNAPPMTLDAQLNADAQAFAESLASQKKVQHSPQNERQGQGENLAKRCSKPDSGFDCKAATDMWYDEVQKYDWGSPGYNGMTGHFTQLVWKGSTKLGVGRASYVDSAGATCYVVVARYKPAGNIKGQFPANVEKGSYVGRRSNLLE